MIDTKILYDSINESKDELSRINTSKLQEYTSRFIPIAMFNKSLQNGEVLCPTFLNKCINSLDWDYMFLYVLPQLAFDDLMGNISVDSVERTVYVLKSNIYTCLINDKEIRPLQSDDIFVLEGKKTISLFNQSRYASLFIVFDKCLTDHKEVYTSVLKVNK